MLTRSEPKGPSLVLRAIDRYLQTKLRRPTADQGVDADRTPTHGYEPTREAAMSLISLNVRFQGQRGPHLLAVSFSQFDPSLPFDEQSCRTAQQRSRATVW